jgi:hypothetical protein
LGNIRLHQEKFDEAETLLQQALAIRLETCGQHEETALSMHNYARLLNRRGKNEDAM